MPSSPPLLQAESPTTGFDFYHLLYPSISSILPSIKQERFNVRAQCRKHTLLDHTFGPNKLLKIKNKVSSYSLTVNRLPLDS
ncbi:hypothetical protein EV44_g3312 [Erysiphe necator]|uniref:Uncharacterized protein n=1 Tax=Uncinula necator TaxID=52586 RepID=A0A0B1P4J0_UNCNE|nr:hypothetical protein EV44_g3312 [Erysiphe necator]